MAVRFVSLAAVLGLVLVSQCLAQADEIGLAVAALQRGDYAAAEQGLRSRLAAQPKDGEALSVLGVVLDQEKKYAEADDVYRKALSVGPAEPALLNNYGNHLLTTGKVAEASNVFLKALALDAQNGNALVQLAQIALRKKAPGEALGYLNRLSREAQSRPNIEMLRMQAEFALGHQQAGDGILSRLSSNGAGDAGQGLALGVALETAGQHEKAEGIFSKVVEMQPDDFDAFYDLGLAASHAGHNERARSALEQAARRQPENVDVLYDLAAVDVALNDKEAALRVLAMASPLAPKRTDVLQLEARVSAALGYFGDAARAWNQYLQIVPSDDVARRERAFAETAIGENDTEALGDLKAFVRKHPTDAVGHYELGLAENPKLPEEAIKELDRALVLKPDLTAAHVARGLWRYKQGETALALGDLRFAALKEPNNGNILDHLGETYMALDRASEAVPVLRKAAELQPTNSTILLHLGRALSKTDHQDEAATVFARSRELGPNRSQSPHPAGLVEFLGLSEEAQRAQYRAGVERTVRTNPENGEAEVRYLEILLDEGKVSEANSVVQTLTGLKLSKSLLAEAVHALMSGRQYGSAKQLLEKAGEGDLSLDLALTEFHLTGPKAGMEVLDKIPEAQRDGNYDLARAEVLGALGRQKEAESSIQHGMMANPTRPDLGRDTALFLIEEHRFPMAVALLSRLGKSDPETLLLQALALELDGNQQRCDVQLKNIESRWPDWPTLWIARALVFEARQQPDWAQAAKQTAVNLGASPELDLQHSLLEALPLLFP